MKFNFSSGITLPYGQYEPALKFKHHATERVCASQYCTLSIRSSHEI